MMHQPCDIEDQLEYYGSMDVDHGNYGLTYIECDSPLNRNIPFSQQEILYAKLLAMYLSQWICAIRLRNDPYLAARIEAKTLKDVGVPFH